MSGNRTTGTVSTITEAGRKYRFSWNLLGDIEKGRPGLGPTTRLEAYRLMQFTFRDVIEEEFGTETADRIFFNAGYLAGREFCKHLVGKPADISEFARKLQEVLSGMNIGILRIEKADPEHGSFIMTVSEDLDCSGLPETGSGVCTYDEGFIAGIMKEYTGQSFDVKEIDCWCTGDRTCRFSVNRCPG